MFLEEKKSHISLILNNNNNKKEYLDILLLPISLSFLLKKKKKLSAKWQEYLRWVQDFTFAENFENVKSMQPASITGTGLSAQELEIL